MRILVLSFFFLFSASIVGFINNKYAHTHSHTQNGTQRDRHTHTSRKVACLARLHSFLPCSTLLTGVSITENVSNSILSYFNECFPLPPSPALPTCLHPAAAPSFDVCGSNTHTHTHTAGDEAKANKLLAHSHTSARERAGCSSSSCCSAPELTQLSEIIYYFCRKWRPLLLLLLLLVVVVVVVAGGVMVLMCLVSLYARKAAGNDDEKRESIEKCKWQKV